MSKSLCMPSIDLSSLSSKEQDYYSLGELVGRDVVDISSDSTVRTLRDGTRGTVRHLLGSASSREQYAFRAGKVEGQAEHYEHGAVVESALPRWARKTLEKLHVLFPRRDDGRKDKVVYNIPMAPAPKERPPDPEVVQRKLKVWRNIHGLYSLWGHMMRYIVGDEKIGVAEVEGGGVPATLSFEEAKKKAEEEAKAKEEEVKKQEGGRRQEEEKKKKEEAAERRAA